MYTIHKIQLFYTQNGPVSVLASAKRMVYNGQNDGFRRESAGPDREEKRHEAAVL